MQQQMTVFRVFIASPTDTPDARVAIREAILLWNASQGNSRRVMLSPIGWETHATPEMGEPPQNIVNRQLLNDADIVIAAFHAKLGTPTSNARSGTVEEIELSIAAGRKVSIYFSDGQVNMRSLDLPEVARLKEYEEECKSRGLLAYYSTNQELTTKLQKDLTHHVDALLGAIAGTPTAAPPTTDRHPSELTRDTEAAEGAAAAGSDHVAVPESAWELLGRGEYDEGMRRAKEETPADPTEPHIDWLAMCQYYAFRQGRVARALEDLRASVQADTTNLRRRFWYARALRHDGRLEMAEKECRQVLESEEEPLRAIAAIELSFVLVDLERLAEAKNLLKTEILRVEDPGVKVDLIMRLAELYRTEKDEKPQLQSFLLRELAIELRPNDTRTTRFDLAHDYSEQAADSMAFAHYIELLKRDPDQGGAANNAGVSAGNLDLPITGIEYYRKAESLDESLATANIAWKLINAGFRQEAESLISKARERGQVHPNLEKAAGELVARREKEEKQVEEISTLWANARKLRIRQARALLAGVDPSTLSGLYEGSPSSLLLSVGQDGGATGSFQLGSITATLSGTFEGAYLSFTWRTVPKEAADPSSASSLLRYSSEGEIRGHGVLIAEGTALVGYRTTEAKSLDPIPPAKLTMWSLQRAASQPEDTSA